MMKTQLEIRMELKSSCVLASYGNAERKKKLNITPAVTLGLSRSWLIFVRSDHECSYILSHWRKNIHTAENYGRIKPSKKHLDQKETNTDSVKICFALLLLSC